MANIRSQQRLWAAELPDLAPFESRFLLKRHGVSGKGRAAGGLGTRR